MTGMDLTKYCTEETIVLPFTVDTAAPLAVSLFRGLIFELLFVRAATTLDCAAAVAVSDRGAILKNDLLDPIQFTMKEL